ncbi:hypothetical protein, variant [Capsaspora owczarzaki ATCC 30864]|nr:hypothetical protein, variant [Capsaspora owczarzaki ATCC 30864]
MGSSVDTFQELTLEREQAASTFNHLRSLFAELTQLQQLVPEHLQSWLQARFQPLFIDYGFVVSEFELLCFPYSDQYSNTRLDRENSLDLSSVTTSAERTELIENKQREQELDRSRRRDEIVHQLEQMAEDERQVLDSRNPLIEEQLRQRRARQEQLERELMELNSMFFDLQHFVQKSASVVTRLEQQVEETKSQVAAGTKELSKAAKIQAVMYPLLFGIVGGAIAGPVGLVAGLKGGGLMSAAALGAGVGAGAGVGVKALRDKFVDQHTPKQSHPSQIAMVNEMAGILIEESPTRPALTVHEKVR